MAELSPAAQAVMDAFTRSNPVLVADPVYREVCAAALRAVVRETNVPLSITDVPEQHQRWYRLGVTNFERKLLTIATELENANG